MKPTKRQSPRRIPVRMLDKYGRQIVCVPLAKGKGPAVVDAKDFDVLMRLGLSSQWLVNGRAPGYVRTPVNGAPGSLIGVSRIIMCASAGRRVRYRDRNPLNLRRDNLKLVDGYATRSDAEAVVKAFERRSPPLWSIMPQPSETFAGALAKLLADAERQDRRTDRPATLPLDTIRSAPHVFQPRTFGASEGDRPNTSAAHVGELVRALKAKPKGTGRVFDSVLVTAIGKHFYVVDGHHRLAAYRDPEVAGTVPLEVPVEYFEEDVEAAMLEAIKRNSKDRLPMDLDDKREAAWRLVTLGDRFSRRVAAQVTGTAESTVANMRRTLKELDQRQHDALNKWEASPNPDPRTMTWAEARQALRDDDVTREFDEEARAALARKWSTRLGDLFGKKLHGQPAIFAEAIEMHSKGLPRLLVEYWEEIAREVIDEMHEADGDTSF